MQRGRGPPRAYLLPSPVADKRRDPDEATFQPSVCSHSKARPSSSPTPYNILNTLPRQRIGVAGNPHAQSHTHTVTCRASCGNSFWLKRKLHHALPRTTQRRRMHRCCCACASCARANSISWPFSTAKMIEVAVLGSLTGAGGQAARGYGAGRAGVRGAVPRGQHLQGARAAPPGRLPGRAPQGLAPRFTLCSAPKSIASDRGVRLCCCTDCAENPVPGK